MVNLIFLMLKTFVCVFDGFQIELAEKNQQIIWLFVQFYVLILSLIRFLMWGIEIDLILVYSGLGNHLICSLLASIFV